MNVEVKKMKCNIIQDHCWSSVHINIMVIFLKKIFSPVFKSQFYFIILHNYNIYNMNINCEQCFLNMFTHRSYWWYYAWIISIGMLLNIGVIIDLCTNIYKLVLVIKVKSYENYEVWYSLLSLVHNDMKKIYFQVLDPIIETSKISIHLAKRFMV